MTESVESPQRATPEQPRRPNLHVFRQLLINTPMTGVTRSFLWFAFTFWVLGPERGLALVFTVAGIIGVVTTLAVQGSKSYTAISREMTRG